jgi:hypothetical protein
LGFEFITESDDRVTDAPTVKILLLITGGCCAPLGVLPFHPQKLKIGGELKRISHLKFSFQGL